VSPGDMLYLTSGGYIAPHGEAGQRFGSERFKALLRDIAGWDPAAQAERLSSVLEAHQGEGKQRDDITIIGVRIQA
ncbi:MAG: SpoIIE family protein phosphatase, partial [Acidobacteria bacterium]|nr:SpoIIE family protein phosphatase [Acidobacteriota bacterium]